MQFFPEHDLATGIANEGPNNGEYCKPEEEVNYEISNQQEETLQEVQYSQPTTIETEQEVPSETAKDSEVVADMKGGKNDDTVKALISTSDGSVNNDTEIEINTEDKDTSDASGSYIADRVKELVTTKESCETSIQQEETLQAEQYPQPITIETKQEVSSETSEVTEVVACIKERENDDAVRILTTTGHDSVNGEAVTNDMTKDEDTNDASSTYTADRVKELETTKENCEISIRQEETPQAEQYPQTITIKKQEVPPETTKGTEVVTCMKERENDDAIRILTSTGHDAVNCEAVTNDTTKDEDTNDASSTYTTDRVEELETTKENYEISI